MSNVWKSSYIPGGYVSNMPGGFGGNRKELTIHTWNREIVFRRYKTRGYNPVYTVTASEGSYDKESKRFHSTRYKEYEFIDENKAMKKFMDLAFTGLAV
jgi:hypothetical protein